MPTPPNRNSARAAAPAPVAVEPAPRPQFDQSQLGDPFNDRDFVDRVWSYLVQAWPDRLGVLDQAEVEEVKQLIRHQERGERPYITPAAYDSPARQRQAEAILSLFNGRNATEVARTVGCSRATVYRVLKQPRRG